MRDAEGKRCMVAGWYLVVLDGTWCRVSRCDSCRVAVTAFTFFSDEAPGTAVSGICVPIRTVTNRLTSGQPISPPVARHATDCVCAAVLDTGQGPHGSQRVGQAPAAAPVLPDSGAQDGNDAAAEGGHGGEEEEGRGGGAAAAGCRLRSLRVGAVDSELRRCCCLVAQCSTVEMDG